MTDQPTPEQIKAFLDDLARISLRHGIAIRSDGIPTLEDLDDFQSYSSAIMTDGNGEPAETWLFDNATGGDIKSIDITQPSAHERLEILGDRSPDFTKMLEEAYTSGACSFGDFCPGFLDDVEKEAEEYAAKIMGGQE